MTAIHYQLKTKPHTPTTIHVEDHLLDQTIKRLESEGQWIQQFRKLIRGKKPDPKRFVVKKFRGSVVRDGLTFEEAKALVGKGEVISRKGLVAKQKPKRRKKKLVRGRLTLDWYKVTLKRLERGLNKTELSLLAGRHPDYIRNAMRRNKTSSISAVFGIAKAFGCKVKEICW